MTQAPVRTRSGPRADARPRVRHDGGAWLPALLLAVRTTAYGLIAVELVVLVLWALAAHSGSGAASSLRLGLAFWAAGHHATVRIGSTSIGIVPYGLTVLPAVLLHRGTRRLLAADDAMEPVAFVPALATCYGLLTAAVAVAARGPLIRPEPAEAFVGAAVLALMTAGSASLRARGIPPDVPDLVRDVAAGAGRALAALLAAGLLAALVTVAVAHHDVLAAGRALHPGVSGVAGLILLDLLLLPHLAVYGASVLAGPGFGLGAHTSVSAAGAHLGSVPALPVLAALPGTAAFPAYVLALVSIPVAAGVLGGLRAMRPVAAGRDRVLRALALAAAGGTGSAAVCWLADGSAGPGRLAVSGPSAWQVGLAVAAELLVGALIAAGWLLLADRRRVAEVVVDLR